MKSSVTIALLFILVCSVPAQESSWGKWTLRPHISMGKLLPGSSIDYQHYNFFFASSQFAPTSVDKFQYAGTTVGFGFRAFPEEAQWLALVIGGGITWFTRPGSNATYAVNPASGVGTQLAPSDFTVYPFTLGLHATYPTKGPREFMLFAGVEGSGNFVSGDGLPIDQSVKAGLGLTTGFAVKVVELGIRYQTFSDMRNLGVYVAFRLNPFDVDFSSHGQGQ